MIRNIQKIVQRYFFFGNKIKVSQSTNYLKVCSALKIRKLQLCIKNIFPKIFRYKIYIVFNKLYIMYFSLNLLNNFFFGFLKCKIMSINNKWWRIFRLDVTQTAYQKKRKYVFFLQLFLLSLLHPNVHKTEGRLKDFSLLFFELFYSSFWAFPLTFTK